MIDLKSIGLTSIFTSAAWIYVLYRVYQNPELIERWSSIGYRLISWAGIKYEKRGIAKDIQADLRTISRTVNSEVPGELLPYGIKIEWKDEETRETFVKDKKVVVRMNHYKNQARNFMNATLSYAEFGLIPHARSYIERYVMRATELIFSNKVFLDIKRHDVRQLFLDEIYNPETQSSSTLERYCNVMDGLEKRGSFTRIALRELSDLGHKVPSGIPTREIFSESVGFTKMLERLVQRGRGEDVNPTYLGELIKCSIVLIARSEKYLLYGLRPYLNFINRSLEKGIETFYVCAIGDQNISITQEIADAYEASRELSVVSRDIYSLKKGPKAICIVIQKQTPTS